MASDCGLGELLEGNGKVVRLRGRVRLTFRNFRAVGTAWARHSRLGLGLT